MFSFSVRLSVPYEQRQRCGAALSGPNARTHLHSPLTPSCSDQQGSADAREALSSSCRALVSSGF